MPICTLGAKYDELCIAEALHNLDAIIIRARVFNKGWHTGELELQDWANMFIRIYTTPVGRQVELPR